MGKIEVPADRYYGAQTMRSRLNFRIGEERMPREIVRSFGLLKKAAALANRLLAGVQPDHVPVPGARRELTPIDAAPQQLPGRQGGRPFRLVSGTAGAGPWASPPPPAPPPAQARHSLS